MSYYPPQSPYQTGMAGKCPRCGEGALFKGFLGMQAECPRCGLDYAKADAGDGPAVFVIFIVGFLGVVAALVLRYSLNAPIAVAFAGSSIFSIGLILGMLRPMKGVLIGLQYREKAAEGALDGGKDDWTA